MGFLFSLVIVLTLTVAVSIAAGSVKRLNQKIALMEKRIENLERNRKEDGENDLPMPGETVVEDGEAVINGTTLQRPYSWYQINPNDSSFAPKNCDQLPLHIIRFMLMKLMDAEANVQHGGLLGWIYDFLRDMINRIRGIFGTMNTEELKQIIGRMQRSGLIKDTGDGIEIIKRF